MINVVTPSDIGSGLSIVGGKLVVTSPASPPPQVGGGVTTEAGLISALAGISSGTVYVTASINITQRITIGENKAVDFGGYLITISATGLVHLQRNAAIFNLRAIFTAQAIEITDSRTGVNSIGRDIWLQGQGYGVGTAITLEPGAGASLVPVSFVDFSGVAIRECGVGIHAKGYMEDGYTNSNTFKGLRMYDVARFVLNGNPASPGFCNGNQYEGHIQPRSNAGHGIYAIESYGNASRFVFPKIWDWHKLDTMAVLLGENDYFEGDVDPLLVTTPYTGVKAPTVVATANPLVTPAYGFAQPMTQSDGAMFGSQDDGLAFAGIRHTVSITSNGTPATASHLKRIFAPNDDSALTIPACTQATITVTLSAQGKVLRTIGAVFEDGGAPSLAVHFESDGAVLAEYKGGQHHCYFSKREAAGGAFTTLKLVMTNTSAKTIVLRKMYAAWANGAGAYMPAVDPVLIASNGAKFKLNVSNTGALSTTPV